MIIIQNYYVKNWGKQIPIKSRQKLNRDVVKFMTIILEKSVVLQMFIEIVGNGRILITLNQILQMFFFILASFGVVL